MTPPLSHAVVVDQDGFAWLPEPSGDHVIASYLYEGFGLAWTPMAAARGEPGAMLYVRGGGDPDTVHEEIPDAVAFTVTRGGLRAFIADLQAIDAALEPET